MNKLIAVCLLLLIAVACTDREDHKAFTMPGEFEPHEAVWLGWDAEDTAHYTTVYGILQALSGKVTIKMAIDGDSLMRAAQGVLVNAGIDTTGIQFYAVPGDRYWIRDHGAAFMTNKRGELAIVDFNWNLYGYYDWWKLREPELADTIEYWEQQTLRGSTSKVDSIMGMLTGATHIKSSLVLEGGALESNGKGVIIQNEQVTLHRNPGWTKEAIEAEFKRTMNVQKVIWMKKGLADDEHIWHLHNGKYVTMGTGGHTDEFVRFTDASTILLAWVGEEEADKHPLNRVTHERMEENLAILEAATDQDGKPFRIIKVPLPNPIEWPAVVMNEKEANEFWKLTPKAFLPHERPAVGDTLIRVAASSYLNFLVTNGTVINATYVTHGTDSATEARVKAIFAEVFPDRTQVWLDALALNRNGGGIHCSTQQQPRVRIKK